MTIMKHFRKRKRTDVEIIPKPGKNDVKASMNELVRLADLLRIKFENHIEMVNKEGKVTTSLNGIHQQFLKIYNSIEKLNV